MSDHYDIVGVGVGPSNLGIAAAISEMAKATPLTAMFFDRRASFDWHPDMLLSSSTMQVSFLKDLSTQRDPRSDFTFLKYLTENGRLSDFINKKSFFPSRFEYTGYLSWAAKKLDNFITFGSDVIGLRISEDFNSVEVTVREGETTKLVNSSFACLGLGSVPKMPEWAVGVHGNRVFHNTKLRSGLKDVKSGTEGRMNIGVVGQGQSAAEVVRHVLEEYADTTVDWFINGYGIVPADSSPFANRVFDPESVDDFFYSPANVRGDLIERHRSTNYSCVDPTLIEWLYDFEYEEKVAGTKRLSIKRATTVTDVTNIQDSECLQVSWLDKMQNTAHSEIYDAIVCATGFESPLPTRLLNFPGADECSFSLDRNYRLHAISARGDIELPIFVVGSTESDHGLSSALLSNIAPRSEEIVSLLLKEIL